MWPNEFWQQVIKSDPQPYKIYVNNVLYEKHKDHLSTYFRPGVAWNEISGFGDVFPSSEIFRGFGGTEILPAKIPYGIAILIDEIGDVDSIYFDDDMGFTNMRIVMDELMHQLKFGSHYDIMKDNVGRLRRYFYNTGR